MSIWAWLKKLFVEEVNVVVEPKAEPLLSIPQVPQIKEDVKQEFYEKEIDMSGKYWLIVIDNTDMPEVNALRPAGLQNFYIVNAPDELTAKGFVWRTFSRNQKLLQQIVDCTHATQLDYVIGMVDTPGKFWSYIPIGGRRAPGQRKIKPKRDSVLAPNEYGVQSATAYQHKPPIVPNNAGHLSEKEIREANRELGIKDSGSRTANQSNPVQMPANMPNMPNMSPEQMMQMFSMFSQMMNGEQPQSSQPISEKDLEKQAEQLPQSMPAGELPPDAMRNIDMSKTQLGNSDEPEDEEYLRIIEAQRKSGNIPKAGNLPDDFDLTDIPEDIENLAKKINED